MSKKLLKQMEFFNEMSMSELSPNQYYVLCCMRDSVSPLKINLHLELRNLLTREWITKDNQLTPKSITLIDKLEKLFILQKKKTSSQLMDKEYKENIEVYKKMFPNMRLPSGKAARSAFGNLEKNFRWFFENYTYTWQIILKATAFYVSEHETKGWKYMRTSQYFIRKDSLSDLADFCEIVQSSGYDEDNKLKSVKVV